MIKTMCYFLLALSLISNCTFAETPSYDFDNLIEYRWKNDVAICIVPLNHKDFVVGGQGFEPKEVLEVQSISGKEVLNFPVSADKKGCFQFRINPAVIGKKGGVAKIIIKRKNDSTPGILTYYWGDQYGKQNISTKSKD